MSGIRTKPDAGYTYVTALIIVFVLALGAQATWIPGSTAAAREREREVIFRGEAYALAIESYWRWTDKHEFPPNVDALLNDPREIGLRHLRIAYDSPVCTGNWRLARAEGGGFSGVRPDCDDAPFQRGGFPGARGTEIAATYADWIFQFIPDENS